MLNSLEQSHGDDENGDGDDDNDDHDGDDDGGDGDDDEMSLVQVSRCVSFVND